MAYFGHGTVEIRCTYIWYVAASQPMTLALFSILMIIAGLIIRERGLRIVKANPRSTVAVRTGLRASAFGAFIAILGAPWLLIGLMTSKFI
jgi:hypothetical protein